MANWNARYIEQHHIAVANNYTLLWFLDMNIGVQLHTLTETTML